MSTVTCPPHPQTPPVLSSLALLPSELLLKIFSDLDPVYSTCLGLTCKRLYVLHRELHGSVRLETRCHTGRNQGPRLYELLEEWHLPGFEMCWCGHSRVKTARVCPLFLFVLLGEGCADVSRWSVGWRLKGEESGSVPSVGLRCFRSRSLG
jgi:F-box-like